MRALVTGVLFAVALAIAMLPDASAQAVGGLKFTIAVELSLGLADSGDYHEVDVSELVTVAPEPQSGEAVFSQELPDGSTIESVQTARSQDLPFTKTGNELRVPLSESTTGFDEFVVRYSVPAVIDLELHQWHVSIAGADWGSFVPTVTASLDVPPDLYLSGDVSCHADDSPCDVSELRERSLVLSIDSLARGETADATISYELQPQPGVGEPQPAPDLAPVTEEIAIECPPRPPASFTVGFDFSSPDYCTADAALHRWPATPGLVIVLMSALIMATVAIGRRSDLLGPRRNDIIIAQYAPPDGLNVMVAAHLLGRSRTAVPAQLLALALSKNIRILERTMRRGKVRYAVQFITLDGADRFATAMLRALFSDEPQSGAIRDLRASDRALGRAVARVSIAALREVTAVRWRHSGGAGQWTLVVLALILTLTNGLVLIAAWVTDSFSPWFLIAFFAAPIALAICVSNIRFVGPVTPRGALIRDHLIGVRDYLQLAEADRLRLLQASDTAERVDHAGANRMIRLHEKLLPYAVVWGVDESWITQLVGDAIDLEAAPDWMSNPNHLTAVGVVDGIVEQWRFTRLRL